MRHSSFQTKTVIILALAILVGLTWTACAPTVRERRGDVPRADIARTEDVGIGKYYFFDDVLIPKDLKYQPGKSFVYETPQFKTGSMVFSKFWLETGSLIDFFVYHMEKDNWKLVNSFQGKESELYFSKPDKTCTIKIVEKWYGTTEVEIRVGPVGTKKM